MKTNSHSEYSIETKHLENKENKENIHNHTIVGNKNIKKSTNTQSIQSISYTQNMQNISCTSVYADRLGENNPNKTTSSISLTLEESALLRKHNRAERVEIRTVHKYSTYIHQYHLRNDRGRVFSETNISFSERSAIINWIIGLQDCLRFGDDTLYFCIQLFDQYIQEHKMIKSKYRLMALAAILVAVKYEEIEWMDIRTMLKTVIEKGERDNNSNTDFNSGANSNINTGDFNSGAYGYTGIFYTELDIMTAEKHLLNSISYEITYVNPLYFLRRMNKTNGYDEETRVLGKYILDRLLLDQRTYKYSHQIKAATAMYFSRKVYQRDTHRNLFLYYAGVSTGEIKECFYECVRILKEKNPHGSVENKYNQSSRHYVNKRLHEFMRDKIKH